MVLKTSPFKECYNGNARNGSCLELACISHQRLAATRDRRAATVLRSFAVLDRLFKYASGRRTSRALYLHTSHVFRFQP